LSQHHLLVRATPGHTGRQPAGRTVRHDDRQNGELVRHNVEEENVFVHLLNLFNVIIFPGLRDFFNAFVTVIVISQEHFTYANNHFYRESNGYLRP